MSGSWVMSMSAPTGWINANQVDHWSAHAASVREWRQAAHWAAKAYRLPKGLDRIHIEARLHFNDRRRRDVHNYFPTIKAVVDGLVDYGLIPDDRTEHLVGPDLRIADPLPPAAQRRFGRLTLLIEVMP